MAYNDTKTAKDRLSKKSKASGIFGKRASALKEKMKCGKCKTEDCKCK